MQVVTTTYLGKLKRPQILLGGMTILWGSLSMLFAFISSPIEFYALRLLLGIAESASFPGSWYFCSLFIPNSHLTVSLGFVTMSAILAMALSAPLALALFKLNGVLGLHDWHWLFIVEVFPAVLVGLYIAMAVPASPDELAGLTADEREELLKQLPPAQSATTRNEL